jgi:peptidoglycan hydrolase-like protein with peptidoglycan-binding domain
MWCDFRKTGAVIAIASVMTVGVLGSYTAFAARQRNYTPQEFRAVLRGLGYQVKVTKGPLTDEETKKAINELQKGYKLPITGQADPKTQDFVATIVQILQGNLNAVLKPQPPLPRNQFYGDRTEQLIKEYQKKNQLTETGIADLRLRQRLDEEAKKVVFGETKPTPTPTATPTSQPSPTATPTTKPTTRPTSKPTTRPTTKPTTRPTSKPTTTPTTKPTTSPTSKPTTTPTTTPTPTP